jgi:subtilisin family serine protease
MRPVARNGAVVAAAMLVLTLSGVAATDNEAMAQQTVVDPLSTKGAVIARATDTPDRDLVLRVARLAQPRQFSPVFMAPLARITGRQMMMRLCGSEQDGYADAVRAENPGTPFDPNAVLGTSAFQIHWPACLYVRDTSQEDLRYLVHKNDTFDRIRALFTGAIGGHGQAAEFVSEGLGREVSEKELPLVGELMIPFQTLPTVLVARSGNSANLMSSLSEIAPQGVSAAEPAPGGEIFVPVEIASAGQPPCQAGTGPDYPFNPQAVAAAYRFAQDSWLQMGNLQQTVHLVIVDNGFFGVPCTAPDQCPPYIGDRLQFSPRFPAQFFDSAQFLYGQLGPVPTTNGYYPINYLNHVNNVDEITGHGTHVAGLALGGPQFETERPIFGNTAAWLKLVVINASAGRRTFARGMEQTIFRAIEDVQGIKVVNLSLTINTSVNSEAADSVRDSIARGLNDTLYVVAAGNSGADLQAGSIYPARLGGAAGSNVLTVASIDGPGTLSSFSNRSREFVDLAAPGCQISSWLDAEHPPTAVSGTSQAAPTVSFAAAMLRSIWNARPTRLKSRLIYSGRLLPQHADRELVRSRAALDIVRALLVRSDVVTFDSGQGSRTLIGTLAAPVQGLHASNSTAPVDFTRVLAFKRAGDSGYIYRRDSPKSPVEIIDGILDANLQSTSNNVSIRATHELVNGIVTALPSAQQFDIPASQLVDLTRAEPTP